MDKQLIIEFQEVEDRFSQAVISNDVEQIKNHITADWVLVDTGGGIISQDRFFEVLEQGFLSHDTMNKQVLRVKKYGDMALVTSRGQNTGLWQGKPMEADEWITDVYKQESGRWLCVLTHLTPVKS